MSTPALYEQVRIFIDKEKGNAAIMAKALSYKTPETMKRWISKKAVPANMVEAVKKFLAAAKTVKPTVSA